MLAEQLPDASLVKLYVSGLFIVSGQPKRGFQEAWNSTQPLQVKPKERFCGRLQGLQVKSHTSLQASHASGAEPGFCNMEQLGVLLLPLKEMLVHCRLSPLPIYTPG